MTLQFWYLHLVVLQFHGYKRNEIYWTGNKSSDHVLNKLALHVLYMTFLFAPCIPARLGGTDIMLSQDDLLYHECDVASHIRSYEDFSSVGFISVDCNPRRLARYVRVRRRPGTYQSHFLNVCEVQVYGYQYEGQHLPLGKTSRPC